MKLTILLTVVSLQCVAPRRLASSNANSNEVNSRVMDSWVKISEAPEPEQHVRKGDGFELECEAVGSPAPVIEWYRGNTPLTDNEMHSNEINEYPPQGFGTSRAVLRVPWALKEHDGRYTCEARSDEKVATATTMVYVSGGTPAKNFSLYLLGEKLLTPAKIIFYFSTYLDTIGNDIELPCTADGNPRATITWLDPSEQVIRNGDDPRVNILPHGKLTIRSVQWGDMGPYTCIAKNVLSQDSITTFLYPMAPSN